jgi:hypothetical protein
VGFEILLFHRGCFAFRSPARMDLFLKPNNSMISVPLRSLCGDLYRTARNISVFQIGMQTPVAFTSRRGGKCVRDAFLNYHGSSVFVPVFRVSPIKIVVWNAEPRMRFQGCL